MSACEVCGETRGNEGPFRLEDGRQFSSVCGVCKCRFFFTSKHKAKFEREMSILASEMLGERVRVEVKEEK